MGLFDSRIILVELIRQRNFSTLHPVSYTHLDVYKRQVLECCALHDTLHLGNVMMMKKMLGI